MGWHRVRDRDRAKGGKRVVLGGGWQEGGKQGREGGREDRVGGRVGRRGRGWEGRGRREGDGVKEGGEERGWKDGAGLLWTC